MVVSCLTPTCPRVGVEVEVNYLQLPNGLLAKPELYCGFCDSFNGLKIVKTWTGPARGPNTQARPASDPAPRGSG